MAFITRKDPNSYFGRLSLLKKLFWLYFLLLVFEGALRKWFLPQLSSALLLIRDPVAIFIIWEAYRTHKWPARWSVLINLLAVALVGLFFVQIVAGGTSWIVGLYGLRSYLLPLPVAFIMGENIDAEDLHRFGICILWLFLPLTALSVAQYLAPAGSILNAGAGKGAEQLSSFGEHTRASATFSFVTGWATYLWLVAAFIFYGLVNKKFVKKWLLWAASFALVLSIPVSGSRSVVFEMASVLVIVSIGAFVGVSQFAKSLKIIVPLLAVFILVTLLPVFHEATATLASRFTEAAGNEGDTEQTLLTRVLVPIVAPLEDTLTSNNWIGVGMGYGSNAVSTQLTGTQSFQAGEGEISRIFIEFGLPAGLAFLLLRWTLALTIAGKAFLLLRDHEPLAWLLVPLTASSLAIGTLEQPTTQGFTVISIAFSLAALNLSAYSVEPAPTLNFTWHCARVRVHSINEETG